MSKRSDIKDEKEFLKKLLASIKRIWNMEENEKNREDMNRYLKRFQGKWWNKDERDESESDIYANFSFSTVMTVAPLITDNKPIWSARARKIYMQDYIGAHKLAAEYLWDKEDMDMKTLEVVLSALIMRKGLMKVYYDAGRDFGGEISYDVIDPRTFFIAPGYTDIWEAPMMGTKERKPISWIREHFPEKKDDIKPDPDAGENDLATNIENKEDWELHDQFVNFYTIWFKDASTEEYFVNEMGEESKKGEKKYKAKYPYGRFIYCTERVLLGDKKCEYKHGRPPYVELNDYKIPFQFMGMGEIDQIECLNTSYNNRLRLIDKWSENYCDPPWLVDTTAGLDIDKVREQIKAGGGCFEFNGSMSKEPITKAEAPTINNVVPNMMVALAKIIEEVSGVTDISKGMSTKQQEQSATEISTLIESSYTRTRQRIRNFEHFLKRVYYLTLEMQQQFYTEPRNFSYASSDLSGEMVWDRVGNSPAMATEKIAPRMGNPPTPENMAPAEYDRAKQEYVRQEEYYKDFIDEYGDVDEIYATFDIEIQTNSTLPMDKQSQANLFLRLLQMAGNNPVTGMPMWKAALENLRIPKHKEIIQEMQELFNKQNQAKAPQGGMM